MAGRMRPGRRGLRNRREAEMRDCKALPYQQMIGRAWTRKSAIKLGKQG